MGALEALNPLHRGGDGGRGSGGSGGGRGGGHGGGAVRGAGGGVAAVTTVTAAIIATTTAAITTTTMRYVGGLRGSALGHIRTEPGGSAPWEPLWPSRGNYIGVKSSARQYNATIQHKLLQNARD